MKKIAVILALALATSPAPAPERKSIAFIEGMLAGIVIGTATGIVIIIGVKQIQRRNRDRRDASRPDWTYPPYIPPTTNAPPGTNVVKMVINAGPALPQFDLSDLGLIDLNCGFPADRGFVTTLQVSPDGSHWSTAYHVYGWGSEFGTLSVVTDPDWHPVATNYAWGSWNFFSLNFPPTPAGFYRCVDP